MPFNQYTYNKIMYHNIRSQISLSGGRTRGRSRSRKERGLDILTITLKQPWLGLIKNNKKTIEGRLDRGIFAKLRIGDRIMWINKRSGEKVLTRVTGLTRYKDFKELLINQGIDKVLPGIQSLDQGIETYSQYYPLDVQKENGVIAIGIQVI